MPVLQKCPQPTDVSFEVPLTNLGDTVLVQVGKRRFGKFRLRGAIGESFDEQTQEEIGGKKAAHGNDEKI